MSEVDLAPEPMPPEVFYSRLGGKLGLRNVRSNDDLAALVARRLPASTAKALLRSGFSDRKVYDLVIPRRTLAHRVANRQPLTRDESDRAIRLARITTMAERTSGIRVRLGAGYANRSAGSTARLHSRCSARKPNPA